MESRMTVKDQKLRRINRMARHADCEDVDPNECGCPQCQPEAHRA